MDIWELHIEAMYRGQNWLRVMGNSIPYIFDYPFGYEVLQSVRFSNCSYDDLVAYFPKQHSRDFIDLSSTQERLACRDPIARTIDTLFDFTCPRKSTPAALTFSWKLWAFLLITGRERHNEGDGNVDLCFPMYWWRSEG